MLNVTIGQDLNVIVGKFQMIDPLASISRQSLTNVLIKYHIFQRILTVHGSIIEGGVGNGGGLMTWALLSAILEPVNHTRRVIGFDTFAGFPSVSEYDTAKVGEMTRGSMKEIRGWIKRFDANRAVGHIPKVELIKGDATETIPTFVQKNPHLIVALLYLDFDLYAPTRKALDWFTNLMPKGAIIAFDELNCHEWPGETTALIHSLGIHKLKLERCAFGSTISWAQL